MYLLTHTFACLWFMVGCPNNVPHHPDLNALTTYLRVNETGDAVHHLEHHDGGPVIHQNASHFDSCKADSWAMQNGRDMSTLKVHWTLDLNF